MRVLEWILSRCGPAAESKPTLESPIGFVPDVARGGLDLSGLRLPPGAAEQLVRVDPAAWALEMKRNAETLHAIGERLPKELLGVHERIVGRLQAAGASA